MPGTGGPARRVTRDDASDASPSWSPDGRRLFFYSNREGNVDLWSIPIEGGEATRIVENAGLDRFPRASPDGKWILFTSYEDGVATLWRMPSGGARRGSHHS